MIRPSVVAFFLVSSILESPENFCRRLKNRRVSENRGQSRENLKNSSLPIWLRIAGLLSHVKKTTQKIWGVWGENSRSYSQQNTIFTNMLKFHPLICSLIFIRNIWIFFEHRLGMRTNKPRDFGPNLQKFKIYWLFRQFLNFYGFGPKSLGLLVLLPWVPQKKFCCFW